MSEKYFIKEDVKRIDVMDERWYEICEGEKKFYLPGVTTFLEAFPKGYGFTQWLKSNGFNSDILFERAGAFGSAFHSLIEKTLHGEAVKFVEHETEMRLWERYLIWCEFWKELTGKVEVTFDPTLIEFIVYDLEYRCAGTVDFMATVDGKHIIMDWKSGNWVGDEAEMQLSAYWDMTEKVFEIEVQEAWIIHIPEKKPNKKGHKIKVITPGQKEVNLSDFRHTQAVWHRANPNAKPKFLQYPMQVDLKYIKEHDIIRRVES